MKKIIDIVAQQDNRWESTILKIAESNGRFCAGFVPKGESGIRYDYGAKVPGPWAYTFELATFITNDPIEVKNKKRAEELARTVVVENGDLVRVDGNVYEVEILRGFNGWEIELNKH